LASKKARTSRALAQARVELEQHGRVARDEARLEQARVDGHVLDALPRRTRSGAHAVAGLEAQVPERVDEVLDRASGLRPSGSSTSTSTSECGKSAPRP
jgi:hypothetical protein